MNREERWQDQAIKVNYNLWLPLSTKTQKSRLYPFSLYIYIFFNTDGGNLHQ